MATLMADLARVAKYVTDPRIRELLVAKDREKKGEHGGIGTPATRSAIIAGLIRRGYIEERSKQVVSTSLGRAFHDTLPASATAPDMTALWHEQQDQIRRGETTLEDFLRGVGAFIADEVVQAREAKLVLGPDATVNAGPVCPACTKGVMSRREGPTGPFLGCSRYPDCRCTRPLDGEDGASPPDPIRTATAAGTNAPKRNTAWSAARKAEHETRSATRSDGGPGGTSTGGNRTSWRANGKRAAEGKAAGRRTLFRAGPAGRADTGTTDEVAVRAKKTSAKKTSAKKARAGTTSGKATSGGATSGKKTSGKKTSGKKTSGKKASGKKASGKKASGKATRARRRAGR